MKTLLALTRFRSALAATFAALIGHVLAAETSIALFPASLGALLVAAGALALNQWQERDLDARMERTRNRPLPTGRMRPRTALIIAIALIVVGLSVLGASGGTWGALVAAVIVAGYNGIYTPLKRVTPFAFVPGAFFGALPPLVGWASAQAPLGAPAVWAMIVFLFLWQMPHVWLLALAYPEDVSRSGLPSLATRLGRRPLARLTFAWIMATIAAGPCLLLYHPAARHAAYAAALTAACVFLGIKARPLLTEAALPAQRMRRLFVGVNLFALIAFGVLALGAWS